MKYNNPYNFFNKVSAIGLILSLLWLTVSTPFVFKAQQAQKQAISANASPFAGSEEDSPNPINNTEEKAPNNTGFSEEYLHDQERLANFYTDLSNDHFHSSDGLYVAYHGELLVPPPNAA